MSTELDIINSMIIVVGEAPVTSTDSLHPTAIQASSWLRKNDKSFQERGWWFNTEYNVKLSPDFGTGKIRLPAETLKVDIIGTKKYVRRGDFLYDPIQHTYLLSDPVQANLILQLPIEFLPPPASNFLTARCVKDFYLIESGGDVNVIKELKEEYIRAWAALRDAELMESKTNAFKSAGVLSLLARLPRSGYSYNATYPGGSV